MDAILQEMIDHHLIRKLLNTYCHASDRVDEARMASVYAEDSWDDHGLNKCPGPEYARRMVATALKGTNSIHHQLGQSQIRVAGDEAGAETYFIATVRSPGVEQEMLNQIGGRYVDTLVKVNGDWKIKKRVCVRDWSISIPIAQDWLIGQGHVQGERSDADPSYAVLGLAHVGVRVAGTAGPEPGEVR